MNNYDNKSIKELIDFLTSKDKQIKNYKKKLELGGLVWQSKSEKSLNELQKNYPILEIIKNKNLEFKSKQSNLLIEGENLHVLSSLNFSHKESIDIIYIDPPYNIGSKSNPDFYYDDKRIDDEDPFRHSKWISFMFKRLKLAKELLKDNGIIFISIDENEVYNLKLLCDEIFGWRNFMSNIKLKVKAPSGVGSGDSFLQDVGEYILIYSKQEKIKNDTSKIKEDFVPEIEKNHTNILKNFLKKKYFKTVDSSKGKIKIFQHHEFKKESISKDNKNMKFYLKNLNNIFRTTNAKGGFMLPMLSKIPKKGLYSFEHKHTKGDKKDKLVTEYVFNGGSVLWFKDYVSLENNIIKRVTGNSNFWLKNYHQGIAKEGGVNFKNGKKPVNLIKDIIKMFPNNKNATILDFFAGSGTTGQAVMELNSEDKGNRNFILITNNEDQGHGKIMSDYCYPRIKEQSKIHKNNLIFLKTKLIKKNNTDNEKKRLFDDLVDLVCVKENTFFQITKNKHYQIFENSMKLTAILFDEDYLEELKKIVSKRSKKANLYIFSYDYVNYANFDNDNKDVNLISFPYPFIKDNETTINLIKSDHEENTVSS